ncbi:energy-coupling factor ABC transporter ATP-binding protein [Methanooceanicella nereidis]|uniref:energy-coupling factor ABC transporter ATP-binding protein n=1 Tax=Methanooceanicella nereidis TaxID=2052831 RepID=UPI001E33C038|nr:ATP-binding cassette domain-containing protein [Methanocella sp. CWC-04]
MIELKNVSVSYGSKEVLKDVSLEIKKGKVIAIMGPNASGKSTMIRLMNGLLLPGSGDCLVDGINTRDDMYYARRQVGMVFQDPEDQLVSRKVLDDVAFGPKNLGFSSFESLAVAIESLSLVGLEKMADKSVHDLSGGQKQLLSIAGVLAMNPSYIAMDEPTSLLDGEGTGLVREIIGKLKSGYRGIVLVTHDPAEALLADEIFVVDNGKIAMRGTPEEIFSRHEELESIGVDVPQMLRFSKRLKKLGADTGDLWSVEGAVREICHWS